jgi:hypothetical protein
MAEEARIAELEPLVDMRVGVGRDFAEDSETMFLVFSTMSDGSVPPPFEFLAASSRLHVRRLFLRDVQNVWYQHGIAGLGNSVDVAAASLRAIAGEHGTKRLTAIGYSAGAYAALQFGTLLGADRVLALEPQTCIRREWLDEIGDDRWDAALGRLDALGGPDPRCADLREAITRDRHGDTRYEVHYNGLFPADERHALRLEGLPGVELVKREPDGKTIVRSLRAAGDLERMFQEAAGVAK